MPKGTAMITGQIKPAAASATSMAPTFAMTPPSAGPSTRRSVSAALTELPMRSALAAARLGCKPEDVGAANGKKAKAFSEVIALAIAQNDGPLTHLSVYEPSRAPITSFAAQVAEVEVDPGTGQAKVKKLTTVHDSGTVLNHLSYTGQIDGGIITGLGFALMEDNSLVEGRMLTTNLGEFKMATSADVPKLTTVLMEDANGPIPFHGKAIAEIPNVPTAAAIANAIQDAVGVRLYDLPLTAEKIYAALNGRTRD